MAYELSRVLDTGLDKETLSILIALCENGVNPEVRTDVSLAATVSLVFADPSGHWRNMRREKSWRRSYHLRYWLVILMLTVPFASRVGLNFRFLNHEIRNI